MNCPTVQIRRIGCRLKKKTAEWEERCSMNSNSTTKKQKSKKKQKQCILTCQNSCEGKSFIAVTQKIVSETVCTLTVWATANGLSCAL